MLHLQNGMGLGKSLRLIIAAVLMEGLLSAQALVSPPGSLDGQSIFVRCRSAMTLEAARECQTDRARLDRQFPDSPSAGTATKRHETRAKGILRGVAQDQKQIWSSPFRLGRKDIFWLIPSAAITATLISNDQKVFHDLSVPPNKASTFQHLSDAGLITFGGVAAGAYLMGRMRENPHLRETGLLSIQAIADSIAVGSVLKYSLRRERPTDGAGEGRFFQSGGDSFVSDHAILSWSVASVLAHEYPEWWKQLGAYGLATLVSYSRVPGAKHFPSDVVVGSALGWAIGRQVYRSHHDETLGGADIGSLGFVGEETRHVHSSTLVPLDHWAYAAMDRLAALGYAPTAFVGTRPWTRNEMRRLIEEAGDQLDPSGGSEALSAYSIYQALQREFVEDKAAVVHFDSFYVRATGIAGQPLNDGYHFAQTVSYDYGRPFGEGANLIAGFSARSEYGRYSFYFRGEYQHAPVGAIPNVTARFKIAESNAIATGLSPLLFLPPPVPFPAQDRFRLMDAYISVNVGALQVVAGKQSLYWGPAHSGAFLFTDNVEPMTLVRVFNPIPSKLPDFLGFLGPIRSEFVFGRLEGHQILTPDFIHPVAVVEQPFLTGGKFSFKPTENLEFGVSVTSVYGGNDFPVTFHSTLRALFSLANETGPSDPGDRRAAVDLTYRIPRLRKWLSFYLDSMAEDESTPLLFPRRSAMNPGLYLAHTPGIPKLDMRVEGFYTNLPGLRDPGFFYTNLRYRSGYTNHDFLLGNVIGRQGHGAQIWSTYWFSPQNTLQFSYRAAHVDKSFIEGGSQQQFWINCAFQPDHSFRVESKLQYERWWFPALANGPRSNVTASVQLTYRPK